MLEPLGYDVTFETESANALDIFRPRPEDFEIVVTDQTMPHVLGPKLAEEAMRIRRGLPVILCTGYSDDVNEGTAADPKIRELVMKPFTIREMASAIRRVLGGRPG